MANSGCLENQSLSKNEMLECDSINRGESFLQAIIETTKDKYPQGFIENSLVIPDEVVSSLNCDCCSTGD
jgi:hypothetical protein